MSLFDMRTVILSHAISNAIGMVVMTTLWMHNRRRFEGLGFWTAYFVLHFLALILVALRGDAPPLLSMTGSTVMLLGGAILIYEGLQRFTGRRAPQIQNYLLLAVLAPTHAYFVLVQPSQVVRNALLSLSLVVVCAQCAWLLLRRVTGDMRPLTRPVGFVFVGIVATSLCRVVVDLLAPLSDDLFRAHASDTLVVIAYQMLAILLAFSLFLMVNRRLLMTLESDIETRRSVETALRLSEEKFSKAFRSSPDAFALSRLEDGHFVEVNDGFCRLTGYSREETLASSDVQLGLWANPEVRDEALAELRTTSHVREREFQGRTKSGRPLMALYSAELISVGTEAFVLSLVRDISDRKRTEDILRLRLLLWEYAATHSTHELMQKALDEIEALTGSLIGFYHFVEEDGTALLLQAWSTRTRREFCKAEAEGMRYPIDEAGVWVDCVRQRGPVIHNDYASLPHRKGMPDGHAAVIRELVVPTTRSGRIVSILGVGNKSEHYDEKDVELVAYIADLVWTIVEQKRADERVLALNAQLERLAMTDDLTSLANRRSFFARGREEIGRARRYHTPLAVMMVDIDRFKHVNDTYGHETGDAALQCVATAIRSTLRDVDIAARLGGEEFGVLLPNTSAAAAVTLAERLRTAIADTTCGSQKGDVTVTASIGVAGYDDALSDVDALLRAADSALYQAKNQGRNRVVLLGGSD